MGIRKVAEARARKRKRLVKRIERMRKVASSLADTPDMSDKAKAKQMRAMVAKAKRAEKNSNKPSFVALKKGGGGKKLDKGKVPKGAKVKVVDRRLKSDRRGEKKALRSSKGRRAAKDNQRK